MQAVLLSDSPVTKQVSTAIHDTSPLLIAVYGSLKMGFGNHCLLRHCPLIGKGTLNGAYMVSLGAFPAIYLEGDTKVAVEVYEVTDESLGRLDGLEGYDSFYNRSIVEIDLEDGSRCKAWVYHFNADRVGKYPIVPAVNGVAVWTNGSTLK